MELAKIPRAGSTGVIKDLSAHSLPLGVWSDAYNFRFIDGTARQFYGPINVFGTPTVTPYYLMVYDNGSEKHWIYAGASAIYDVEGTTHTDISGTSYTATPNSWTGGVLGGIPILNNGTDDPQQWDTNLANNFADLSNWPASTTCKALRTYKQFLIALNITKSGTSYPYMVKWSHPAVPGSVPASWDETDADYDTGEQDLAETFGHLVDGFTLGNSFIIYKEDTTHRMDYIGGTYVFSFDKILDTGIMGRNCAVEVSGKHYVLTPSDVITHTGREGSDQSILDGRTRRYLFQQMDAQYRSRAFVFHNKFFQEVYICYPKVGSTACDEAMVWNYRDGTTTFKSLPDVYYAVLGTVEYSSTSVWSADTDDWDSDVTLWNDADPIPGESRVLMASADTELYFLDGELVSGTAYLERQGIPLGDDNKRVLVTGLRLRIKGDVGATVKVSVGGTDTDPYATPTYDAEKTLTLGSSLNVDCMVSRRYFAFKIENIDAYTLIIESYDILGEEMGEW